MFSKNNKPWFRHIVALVAVSLVLAVSLSIADTIYSEHTQATLGDITSDTQVTAASATDDRTTIGIAEKVDCSIDPNTWADKDCKKVDDGPWTDVNDTIGDKTWSAIGSGGTVSPTSGTTTVLTAKKTPAGVTVKVTVYDSLSKFDDAPVIKTKPFSVIAPNGEIITENNNPGFPPAGNNNIGAWTNYDVQLTPTSVSFINATFREHIEAQTLPNWPNGTPLSVPAADPCFAVSANNYVIGGDDISSGPYPKSRLDNNPDPNVTNYVDHQYDVNWDVQYLNESSDWETYNSLSTTTRYKGSTLQCQQEYEGDKGDWQGPWQ